MITRERAGIGDEIPPWRCNEEAHLLLLVAVAGLHLCGEPSGERADSGTQQNETVHLCATPRAAPLFGFELDEGEQSGAGAPFHSLPGSDKIGAIDSRWTHEGAR